MAMLLVPAPARAQSNRNIGTAVKTAVAGMRVLKVRDNVYMISGAGGNVTVLTFAQGVLVVDTGSTANADKVLSVIKELSDKPVVHIINTNADADHVGGNEKLAVSGRRIPRDIVQADSSGGGEGPMVIAREEVLARMSAPPEPQKPAPFRAWPTDVYHFPTKKLSAHLRGGEAIQLIHAPAAHSDGDSLVWFRHADLILAGDVFTTTAYPVIDVAHGGTINGEIEALNAILDLAFPFSRMEGGTMIIPGHGRLSDFADVAYYRDMVTIVRDRIQDMLGKKMTLQQVNAAKPTLDFDPRYGPGEPFVEAVYKTLGGR
jgi:glyoxylase-like metal-dependent hydrolase (beta-lactamase superfamily II)